MTDYSEHQRLPVESIVPAHQQIPLPFTFKLPARPNQYCKKDPE